MSFRFPYLSLDLETTGLDVNRSHILQIGAVYDDGGPLENLQTFETEVKWPLLSHCEVGAMKMNWDLIKSVMGKDAPTMPWAASQFNHWLMRVQPEGKVVVAGKNVGGFDIPIMSNSVNRMSVSRFSHRCLDPGSMYSTDFDHVPGLGEINKITGRGSVTHDALSDALDVVYAIRYKWGAL